MHPWTQEKPRPSVTAWAAESSLHMARYGADLDAVASFHGSLPLGVAPAGEGGEVSARIAVYHGEDDVFIPDEAIAEFKAEMKKTESRLPVRNDSRRGARLHQSRRYRQRREIRHPLALQRTGRQLLLGPHATGTPVRLQRLSGRARSRPTTDYSFHVIWKVRFGRKLRQLRKFLKDGATAAN